MGWLMKKQQLRRSLNYSALGLLVAYLAGIVIVLLIFSIKRFDEDFEFIFTFNFLLWGGVSLLISVFLLMVTKLIVTRG